MKKDIVSTVPKVLMLGVGGVSMCQLAKVYLQKGYVVYGYDHQNSKSLADLEMLGAKITNRFNPNYLDVDFCVKTAAIKQDNAYVQHLQKQNIPIVDRAEALGKILKNFKCVIAVAGTHGKSTTASLIYEILRAANKKVSCHIGAEVDNARFAFGDDFVVVEACEYNKSFLHISPDIAVVTNVEPEHLDSYGNFKNLQNAFATFLKRAKTRFVFKDDTTKYLEKYKNVQSVAEANFKTRLKGEYNQKNISLAVAVCEYLQVDTPLIFKVVEGFKGIPRRYECLGEINKTKIFIDYAHHPTELKSFVETFKTEYKNSLVIFQPHTYSRTKLFFNEFVKILSTIGNVYVYKEYPAREKKSCGIDAKTLCSAAHKINQDCKYLSNLKNLKSTLQNFDAVAFVGAGDIDKLARKIVKGS